MLDGVSAKEKGSIGKERLSVGAGCQGSLMESETSPVRGKGGSPMVISQRVQPVQRP